jgi:hypothetical protein
MVMQLRLTALFLAFALFHPFHSYAGSIFSSDPQQAALFQEVDRNTAAQQGQTGAKDLTDETKKGIKDKEEDLKKQKEDLAKLEEQKKKKAAEEKEGKTGSGPSSEELGKQVDQAKLGIQKTQGAIDALKLQAAGAARVIGANANAAQATADAASAAGEKQPVGSLINSKEPIYTPFSESLRKENGNPDTHHNKQFGYNDDGTVSRGEKFRGWTNEDIAKTLDNPSKAVPTSEIQTGGREAPQAATAYFKEGSENQYVIRNDSTGRIIQISDLNKPDWKPDIKPPLSTTENPLQIVSPSQLEAVASESSGMFSSIGGKVGSFAEGVGNTFGVMEQAAPGSAMIGLESPAFQSLNESAYGLPGLALTGSTIYTGVQAVGGTTGIVTGVTMTGETIAAAAATPVVVGTAAVTATAAGSYLIPRSVDYATGNRISGTGGMILNGVWDTVSGAASSVYHFENRMDYGNSAASWEQVKGGSSSFWGW